MPVQICSCSGLDPNCKKCFGSGYSDDGMAKESFLAGAKKKAGGEKETAKQESVLPENFKSLNKKELERIAFRIIDLLDVKSKKQMQLLNSISFSTTTFRRDDKNKFESLRNLEAGKQFLRSELGLIAIETAVKKIPQAFTFGHFLSDKDIDVDSNRDLKTLIREYKKAKVKGSPKKK
jgi:hypothetical protein